MDVKVAHMSAGMSIFLVISSDMVHSLVVEVRLDQSSIHGVWGSMHHIIHCTHGTELDIPSHGGFHKESGPRGSCSMVVSLRLGQIATPNP